MRETELVSETLSFYRKFTRIIVRANFIAFIRHENFKSYKNLFTRYLSVGD
jgi:hypothetical protein